MKVRGKISWFGGPRDAQDNNVTSTGIPNSSVAGIATPFEHTKRGWWFLYRPGQTGRGQLVQDIETGPGKSTGRQFDLNPRAAHKFGWRANDKAFPTDSEMEGVFLGHDFHKATVRAQRLKTPQAPRAIDRWPATNLGGIPLRTVAQALAALQQ